MGIPVGFIDLRPTCPLRMTVLSTVFKRIMPKVRLLPKLIHLVDEERTLSLQALHQELHSWLHQTAMLCQVHGASCLPAANPPSTPHCSFKSLVRQRGSSLSFPALPPGAGMLFLGADLGPGSNRGAESHV